MMFEIKDDDGNTLKAQHLALDNVQFEIEESTIILTQDDWDDLVDWAESVGWVAKSTRNARSSAAWSQPHWKF